MRRHRQLALQRLELGVPEVARPTLATGPAEASSTIVVFESFKSSGLSTTIPDEAARPAAASTARRLRSSRFALARMLRIAESLRAHRLAPGRPILRLPMAIERSHRRLAAARITATARQLLEASTLCAVATVARSGRAHVNTAYFAWSRDFEIVWLSEPGATHSRNLRANPSTAIAVYDSGQTWGKPDRGIQLFGTAREVAGDAAEQAEALYGRRFPAYAKADLGAYRFYRFTPRRLKLFDEPALGAATFVTARVGPDGRLAWERTERYRASR
jgi:uncharacterized protein YhbP (UPF0306 family)